MFRGDFSTCTYVYTYVVCVCDLTHLVCVSRRDDVSLYGLREVFAIPHRVAKLPEQLSGDLWRHGCV